MKRPSLLHHVRREARWPFVCYPRIAAGALLFIMASGWAGPRTASPAAGRLYHPDPRHLWNRLHDGLFLRVGPDGKTYGHDRLEPLLWSGSRHLLEPASGERAR